MKVIYDYQIFSSQKYGGISRYFFEIMKEVEYQIPLIFNQNFYLNQNGILIKKPFKGKSKIFNLINKQYTKFYLQKSQNYDIFHPTYYDIYFLNYIQEKPFVLTIHDMIHEKFQTMFPKDDRVAERKAFLAKKAKKIIAVSHNTKQDIIDILKIKSEKIEVIYHGSSFRDIKEDIQFKQLLPNKYILFTGNRNGYKNFNLFIEAVQDILNSQNELYVICAGGGKFSLNEIDLFKKLNIEHKIIQYSCDDTQLKTLYSQALFFIFPSLYEGFGIPLLEAMASNCPILCSDASCFPEIVNDSAILFNPYDVNHIKEKIKYALSENLEPLLEKSQERLKYFSWNKARKETFNVYKKVLN